MDLVHKACEKQQGRASLVKLLGSDGCGTLSIRLVRSRKGDCSINEQLLVSYVQELSGNIVSDVQLSN